MATKIYRSCILNPVTQTPTKEFKRLEYPRPSFLTRSSNLEASTDPTVFSLVQPDQYAQKVLSSISMERNFAQEEMVTLAEWLNLYNLKREDFGATLKKDKVDPVLAASIIIHGLNNGFSFAFLSKHIVSLCRPKKALAINNELPLRDPLELSRCQAAVMFSRPSLEFKDKIKTYVFQLIRETPASKDTLTESACFTALLSFLCKEKIVIPVNFLNKIRNSREDNSLRLAIDAGLTQEIEASDLSKIPRLSFSSHLLTNPDNDSAFEEAQNSAKKIDELCSKLILSNKQYIPDLLPSQSEKDQAVNYFLDRPKELSRLFSTSYKVLLDGFRDKPIKGFHDHDQRHILFAVPATGLMLAQKSDPYTKIFGLLCCLLHDAGRIIEPGFCYTDPRRSKLAKIHPQISAAVTNNILDQFPDLPIRVRNEIITTVAMHDSGAVTNSQLSIFAQSVDRLQLIGPEYITRALGYILALQNKPFYSPPSDPHPLSYGKSLLGSTSFYLHKLYPNYAGNTDIESRLSIASGTFISLATRDLSLSESYFESDILPRAHWPSLADNLNRSIQRSCFKWMNGHCLEWPSVQRCFKPSQAPQAYVDRICSLPLVSSFDYKVNDIVVAENLRNQIEVARISNPEISLSLEYISKVALNYDLELKEVVRHSSFSKCPALKSFAIELSKHMSNV